MGTYYRDLAGKRFGRQIAIKRVGTSKNGAVIWLCQCDCGNFHNVCGCILIAGTSKSCGCLRREVARRKRTLLPSKLCPIHNCLFVRTKPTSGHPVGQLKCRLCRNEEQVAYVKLHKEKISAYQRNAYRQNKKQRMLSSAKGRAKKFNLPFSFTIADFDIPQYCPILGLELEVGDGRPGLNSPSLDRIIPNLGYVKGNVEVISYRANKIKSDATPEELQKIADYCSQRAKAE